MTIVKKPKLKSEVDELLELIGEDPIYFESDNAGNLLIVESQNQTIIDFAKSKELME
jgi:hypothetical protein